jgi:hypothetical protein
MQHFQYFSHPLVGPKRVDSIPNHFLCLELTGCGSPFQINVQSNFRNMTNCHKFDQEEEMVKSITELKTAEGKVRIEWSGGEPGFQHVRKP